MGGEGKDGWTSTQGRWPANVIFDEVTAGLLDEQSGASKSAQGGGTRKTALGRMNDDGWQPKETEMPGYGDSGGASRFFYVAKASRRDRNEGLEELEAKSAAEMTGRKEGSAGLVMKHVDGSDKANAYAGTTGSARQNFHPTVKPTALMRYLIKLVTPPGGTVLDPFTGSGSTGKAALLDGFQFVGVELTEEYLPIIEGRLRWASEQVDDDDTLF
jgi:site-specific DNA-methyltransferase (adenine-specific)